MFKQEYLCHYGILGMKWGVRRYQNKDGTLTAKGKKHKKQKVGTSKDYKRTKAIQAKSIKQMSNAELKEVTERMRLVNEFQNQARQSLRNGKHWVNATLDKTGGLYVSYITSPAKVLGTVGTAGKIAKASVVAAKNAMPSNNIVNGSLVNIV